METNNLISIHLLCTHYNIPISFINSLNEYELIELVTVEEIVCIHKKEIKEIEKMIRLHYELEINMEGMDVIYNLLNQVEILKNDISSLNNKLRFYEE